MGIYRAGGPTTIFGGSGWGPFSDGPLNAVRKSLLSRDGVTEENWMWMAATRAVEANEEWSKWRKEGIKELDATGETVVKPEVEEDLDQPAAKRPRLGGALGVYEPHSGIIHCESCIPLSYNSLFNMPFVDRADMQPTRSRWEPVREPKKYVLGGTKAGNGAWGLAWVDVIMETATAPDEENAAAAMERERLWREATSDSVSNFEDLT